MAKGELEACYVFYNVLHSLELNIGGLNHWHHLFVSVSPITVGIKWFGWKRRKRENGGSIMLCMLDVIQITIVGQILQVWPIWTTYSYPNVMTMRLSWFPWAEDPVVWASQEWISYLFWRNIDWKSSWTMQSWALQNASRQKLQVKSEHHTKEFLVLETLLD